ncbi:M23 family metallopeptidase [Amycolatopsis aidingensis]|uniref:M23 family metallopeptidase n=1 Tax=Amycolatopsis aidingensis TaxID=2842453 RepID=UPI001C0D0451|nr:M23 family metallopeptidase [Amycolatopsis aidingensis]
MRLTRFLGAVAAAAMGLGALTVANAPEASAATNFQMPFPCNQTWSGQTRTNHSPRLAVDFNRSGDHGDTVVASAAGTVSKVRNEGSTSYGRWIEIDHGSGWTTRYAHLSRQSVSVGARVAQGQKIGEVGNTGGSTGAHLHFEERHNGVAQRIEFNGSQIYYYGTRSYTSKNCGGSGNPYTPEEACGSGYGRIDSAGLGSAGRVYLLYNNSNGYNCVVTMKSTNIGKPTAVSASLQVKGGSKTTDSGNYSYYAGPVRKSAADKCVQWGGSIGSASYESPYEHCGS